MKNLLFAMLLFAGVCANAQELSKNYKVVFYKEVTFETDDYNLYLVKCFTRKDLVKFKIRIFNKTKDFLYIKPQEFVLTINGEQLKPSGKTMIVQPDGEESQMLDVLGAKADLRCDAFEIALSGLYKVPAHGEVQAIGNTALPAKRQTELKAGPFTCTLLDNQIEKGKSIVKYSCVYNGDQIGVLNAATCKALQTSGNENANSYRFSDAKLLEKGQEATFTAEFKQMNTGNMAEGIQMKWHETFMQSPALPLKAIKVPMKIDVDTSEK